MQPLPVFPRQCRIPLRGVRRGTVPPTVESLSISSAFLTAAVVLYFPANILPIMISSNPAATSNTIFSGIAYMWDEGDRLIAAVIFSASILAPVLKIAAMSVLIAAARFALVYGRKEIVAPLPHHRSGLPLVDD